MGKKKKKQPALHSIFKLYANLFVMHLSAHHKSVSLTGTRQDANNLC